MSDEMRITGSTSGRPRGVRPGRANPARRRPTDEGFRIIAVWENEPAWQRFRTEGLAPAIACLGGPAPPEPTFRDLHTAHLVVGERGKWGSLQSQTQENEQ
jgi:hypothetical protein